MKFYFLYSAFFRQQAGLAFGQASAFSQHSAFFWQQAGLAAASAFLQHSAPSLQQAGFAQHFALSLQHSAPSLQQAGLAQHFAPSLQHSAFPVQQACFLRQHFSAGAVSAAITDNPIRNMTTAKIDKHFFIFSSFIVWIIGFTPDWMINMTAIGI